MNHDAPAAPPKPRQRLPKSGPHSTVPRPPRPGRAWLLAVFLLALTVRLTLFALGPAHDIQRAFAPDSRGYVTLSESLTEFRRFGKPFETGRVHKSIQSLRETANRILPVDEHGLIPDLFRTPGYPFYIAVLRKVTGSLGGVLVFQCIGGSIVACLSIMVFITAGLSLRTAYLLGIFWAVHPAIAVADNLIMSESLFLQCTSAALVIAATATRSARWWATGLLLGFSALVRPLGLFFLPAAMVLLWKRRRLSAFSCVAMVLVAAILPSLWIARNHRIDGILRLSTVGSVNLLYYGAAYTRSETLGRDSFSDWHNQVSQLTEEVRSKLNPAGADVFRAGDQVAIETLLSNPGPFVKVLAKAQFRLFLDASTGRLANLLGAEYVSTGLVSRLVFGEDDTADRAKNSFTVWHAAKLIWVVLNLMTTLAALVGAIVAIFRRDPVILIVGVGTTCAFMAATNVVGLERMRISMMLPLLLLVGFGIQSMVEVRQKYPN